MNLYPVITVITVVYNNMINIEKTILSVLSQSYSNIEYIIVDGQSSDGTMDIVRRFKDHISLIISEKDNGIYDAMNKGIRYASGEYVIFMNSGDLFYDNNVVFNIAEILKFNSNIDVIFGNTNFEFSSYSKIQISKNITSKNPMPFCHQSVFVKRLLLIKYGFDDNFKICADRDFFSKIFVSDDNIKYYNTNIMISSIEAIGFSNLNRIDTTKEYIKILLKYKLRSHHYCYFRLIRSYVNTLVERVLGQEKYKLLQRQIKIL